MTIYVCVCLTCSRYTPICRWQIDAHIYRIGNKVEPSIDHVEIIPPRFRFNLNEILEFGGVTKLMMMTLWL